MILFSCLLVDHPLASRRPNLQDLVEEGCPADLRVLIQECWADDVTARPKFVQCVARLDAILASITKPVAQPVAAPRRTE
eukprot:SAG25_NODE_10926_length_319_cov_0.704545_1_plen_79_part_01